MSSDKVLAFSSTNISNAEIINNFTKWINSTISHRVESGTMTEADAQILRKMLIRIQTDTNLLTAIKEFNKSFLNLDINWTIGATSILNDNMDSSVKLASLLVLILA